MITITSGKFVDLIADAGLFACQHEELIDIYAIRLEWDGEMLHAFATDTLRTARVSWSPDDDADGNDDKQPMVPYFGGDDAPWTMLIQLDEALELVKHFTLPKKLVGVPITLDYKGGKMIVHRAADTGHQDVKVAVITRMIQFPDLKAALEGPPPLEAVDQLDFIPGQLGDFVSVRQRGLLRMKFNGRTGAVRIAIGKRFVGTLRPDVTALPRQKAFDLRNTTGLVSV